MAEQATGSDGDPELVASFFTLSGAGFGEPPRHGFERRCEAAAAAGFSGLGLHVDDLARTRASGLDVAGMRALLDGAGLRLVEIEFLGGWALEPVAADDVVAGVEAVAAGLGGRHVTAGEFRPGDLEPEAAAARLAELAGRLGERGLLVALEAFPWSALPDVGAAVDLLRRAGAANAGLMVDVWHFFNGGAGLDALDDLPGAGVAAVQLNDGPRVHADFLQQARAARRLPGHGELDVVGLVRAVQATGFAGPWCVEVNTPEFRALPVEVAAKTAAEAARTVLDAARG
ncbi:TIM barrel protein [Blastococcus sp. CT_GayMR19]|uniref:sugar phosphate isomerase/epimerase family protein n=1 Tax=Blastococcus sp. CT_GayMR19 TaxID=2559608 RepID=UPI0014317CDA|nr:TIM barrel protein [Blastococcus sp. CT_GayMR19]